MTIPSRIAIGYDGSPAADAALRWAATLAQGVGARLLVVHAVGLLEHAGFAPAAGHEAHARSIAGDAGLDLSCLEWRVADGDPAAVLRRAAGEDGADLIVVGTRGAGAHPGASLGSTSMELAEGPPVPLVVVPATHLTPNRVAPDPL